MPRSLEDAITEAGGAVPLLWNLDARPGVATRIPAEYSNWRSEQMAWRQTAVLFVQSHHMVDLTIKGKDARRLISEVGVNDVDTFPVDRAKQFVAVNHEGKLIGDNILFHLAEDEFRMVGLYPAVNWVQYQAAKGGYDVDIVRDDDSRMRGPGDPVDYRFQVQGPRAMEIIEAATGAPVPQVPFFGMTRFTIGGRTVRALRHGMSGTPGFELWGPWADEPAVFEALLSAGAEFGMLPVGSTAYHTNAMESGWFSRPIPAIYTGDAYRDYRAWLPATSYEANSSLGGSWYSEDLEDYYVSPYDLGYGRVVSFDHDFIGRDALAAQVEAGRSTRRGKVTLVWDGDDVTDVFASWHRHDGLPAKFMSYPQARYANYQIDRVESDGRQIGFSGGLAFSANERAILSLGVLEADLAEPGTRVEIVWGEDPNSAKPVVEPHRQVRIRATVQPAPLDEWARTQYRRD